MPNGRTHFIAGTICGALGSLVIQDQLHDNKELDTRHLLLSTGTGAAVSRLPDILEPAFHPNHRAFFHSFTFGALLGFAGVQVVKKIKEKRRQRKTLGLQQISGTEILLAIALVAIVVISLYLLMDMFTKRGLPVV